MVENFHLKAVKDRLVTPIFTIKSKIYHKPDNTDQFNAYIIDSLDWVNIIALTSEKKVVMIQQFRFGTDSIELEIPGGIIEPQEKPLVAAQRELEEETGYKAKNWSQIGVVNANPAIQSNRCYTFLAEDATPTGSINCDPNEYIEHQLMDIGEMKPLIKKGIITNTYIIAAFFWYFLHKEER